MPAVKLAPSVSQVRIPASYSLQTTGMTQSLLSSWQTCPRRFLFQVNRYFLPDKSKTMGYGTMVHGVLDAMYTGFYKKRFKYGDLGEVIRAGIKKHKFESVFQAEEIEYMRASALAILDQYIIHYKRDFSEMRFDAVERTFGVLFGDVTLRGKVDGRFKDKNGGVWHIEHKNFSRVNEETILLKLSFDLQNQFYMLADLLEYNRLLKGTLYNILRRPDVRKQIPPKETHAYVTGLIKANPKYYFMRYEIPYSMNDINQFRAELERKLDTIECNIIEARRDPQMTLTLFWRNEVACESPYRCEYLTACASNKMTGFSQKKNLFEELA
jgi:hypothetical protein